MQIRFFNISSNFIEIMQTVSTGKIRSFYLTLRTKTKKTSQFDMVSITIYSMFIHFFFFPPRNLSQVEFNSWTNIQCFTLASTTNAQTTEGKHVRKAHVSQTSCMCATISHINLGDKGKTRKRTSFQITLTLSSIQNKDVVDTKSRECFSKHT